MKANNKSEISLEFKNENEKIEFLADTIQLDIMHKIGEFLKEQNENKSLLAEKMKVSNSFISQLFSADKHLSLKHIATMAIKLGLEIKIDIEDNSVQKIDFQKIESFFKNSEEQASNIFGDICGNLTGQKSYKIKRQPFEPVQKVA
jgi:hypothetical protein